MSTTTRPPLLSDDDIRQSDSRSPAYEVRDIYEAARAKDAELIQRLVDWLHRVKSLPDVDADERCWMGDDALAAAAAAGFKPTEP